MVTVFCTLPELKTFLMYENLVTFSITLSSSVTTPLFLALPVEPEHFCTQNQLSC